MPYQIVKSEEEIDDLLQQCVDREERRRSKYPGLAYEQGVQAALLWVTGNRDEHPLD